jgi:hypothetical protein
MEEEQLEFFTEEEMGGKVIVSFPQEQPHVNP